ncbi:MAG: hypothetical protein Q7T94_10075 [Rugosibacter sp.]|nr:hypothetical protein [Rugosibacter sp.]
MSSKKIKIHIVQLDSKGKKKVKEHPKDFMETIRAQVELCLPKMVAGISKTLRTICGEDFWTEKVNGEETYAGICMAQLVSNNRLPLIRVGRDYKNAALYRLK